MKKRYFLAIALIIVGFAGLAASRIDRQKKSQTEQQTKVTWEYKWIYNDLNKLNEFGQEGWELVSVSGDVQNTLCVLKRRK